MPLPKGKDANFGEALTQFFSVDKLTKDNKYMCSVCKTLQNATKRLTMNTAPRILIITIKRFDIFGRKISKRIRYPSAFNMKPFMDASIDKAADIQSTKTIGDEVYDLYGVVIHEGNSTDCGHYYAYCKNLSSSKWYECNDSYIRQMSDEKSILNKEAYLLFY